ncbi:MAG: hypothetical protein V1915_03335 [Candidatus Bathyarchaeota archaeon]
MKRGEREEAIRLDLKGGKEVSIKFLSGNHPRSSVYAILKKLKETGEGRFVTVEQSGKQVSAFQLIERIAPYEEVEILVNLLSEANPTEIRKEAAKDFMALASKYEKIPDKAIDFLLCKWHQPSYAMIQDRLLTTLWRITVAAKAKGFHEVIEKVKSTTDKVLKIAKNFNAAPGLREAAWELLILLENPRIVDTAFELLTHKNEQEVVMSYVREEVKLYAGKNPLDAKKRLYDILRGSKEGTPTHQRILSLLQAIRYPSASMKVPKIE